MDKQFDVTWKCPNCGVQNLDNIEVTAMPACSECDTTLFWDEILPEQVLYRFDELLKGKELQITTKPN